MDLGGFKEKLDKIQATVEDTFYNMYEGGDIGLLNTLYDTAGYNSGLTGLKDPYDGYLYEDDHL